MNLILGLLCAFFSNLSFGQLKPNFKSLPISLLDDPIVYFDSIPTRMGFFSLDSSEIKSIARVENKPAGISKPSNEIYITSRIPSNHKFLSFLELKNTFVGKNKKPILLLVNGSFIKNPTQINIDSAYIYRVEVESGADFEELKNIYPLLTIVNIQTNNLKDQRIRDFSNPQRQIFLYGLPNKSEPE